jgi:hypothetical protein
VLNPAPPAMEAFRVTAMGYFWETEIPKSGSFWKRALKSILSGEQPLIQVSSTAGLEFVKSSHSVLVICILR